MRSGVIQPVAEIGRICRARGVPFHCDAVQAAGQGAGGREPRPRWICCRSPRTRCYAPRARAPLYVRRRDPRVELAAQMDGGGARARAALGNPQRSGNRGFGEACAIAAAEDGCRIRRLRALRDRLLEILESEWSRST